MIVTAQTVCINRADLPEVIKRWDADAYIVGGLHICVPDVETVHAWIHAYTALALYMEGTK